MLYIVGDSNSVYTAPFLMGRVDASTMCKEGWTSAQVFSAVQRRARSLEDASGFFVFVGLNDDMTGEAISTSAWVIVQTLRTMHPFVPVFLAPPFCIEDAVTTSTCDHRRAAARHLIAYAFESRDAKVVLVTAHLKQTGGAKKAVYTQQPNSVKLDPLHLSSQGYRMIATELNPHLKTVPKRSKRSPVPKTFYEAGPAPPPRVAWAAARARMA